MSRYVPQGASGSSGPFSAPDGAAKFYNTGGQSLPSAGNGVYVPTPSGAGSGTPGGLPDPKDAQPGVISINPLDPTETLHQAGAATQGMFDGLASALFGPKTGVLTGGLTGAIADDKGAGGDLGRFAGGLLGGVGDTLKNAAGVVGGGLERIPNGGADTKPLDAQFDAMKADNADFRKWLADKDADGITNEQKYTGDKGLFDTGVLGTEEHYKSKAIRAFAEDTNGTVGKPSLLAGDFTAPGSLADSMNNMMDGLGLFSAGWQRTLGGIHNRAEEARRIGEGSAVSTGFLGTGFMAGSGKATPAEQLVAQKMNAGEWNENEAMDFLVASGMTAHDAGLTLAISVASPDIAASFGMAGLAKAGAKGAEIVAGASRAAEIAANTEKALEVAQTALDGAKAGSKAARVAGKALDEAKAAHEASTAAVDSFKTYRTGETINRLNFVDRMAQGHELPQKFVTAFGRTYDGLEGTYLGRAAKTTRYLIDPLHGIDLHMPGQARMVDLYSDALTNTLADVAGQQHYLRNFYDLRALDRTGKLADEYARALGTAATNRGREGILTLHQASSVDRGLAGALQTAEAGASNGLREDVIASAAQHMRQKDLTGWLKEDYVRNVFNRQEEHWTEAEHRILARKLESMTGGLRTEEQWMEELPKMSKEQKSLFDFAYYGHANKTLLDAASTARAAGHMGLGEGKGLERLVLLSSKTLSRVGADSLLSKLKSAKSGKKQLRLIAEAQQKYPELGYITMDSANPGKSIGRFTKYLEDHMEGYPMQVLDDELAQLPTDLQDLNKTFGGGYQLGFRPKDEFLWGIERVNERGGSYMAKYAPWADHVAEGGRGYRPGLQLPVNIQGMPLVGAAAMKAAKTVDYIAAGSKMLAQQVTGAQIHEVARQRFVSMASKGPFKEAGLSEGMASKWWDTLQEYVREHQGYSGPRGLGKGDLYKAIASEGLIPSTMLNGAYKIGENDILRMVLNAYDGDMRFIGLTQKLSGRVKVMMSAATGYQTNFAGQIAEHAWPMLKFRYNPIFQLQEKVEPFVLNAQRGITSPFASATLSEADRATERLLNRLTDGSLIRQADLDQAEYVQLLSFDKRMKSLYADPGSRMNKIASRAGELMDVQGVKRIAAVRTFRKGLGKELRSAWEEVQPGVWQDMKTNADAMAGHVLDEDEFGVQLLNENLFANDIVVRRLDTAGRAAGLPKLEAEWDNAIKTGEWHRPAHIGELKALDLDHVAKGMGSFMDGQTIKNMGDMRRVIAGADKPARKIEEVSDFLRRMGADKDYIGRVENSLKFSWTGFWQEAGKRYNLSFEESKRLQDMVGGWAELRGMTPIDFMSQVFDPGIIDGTEGLLGSLDNPIKMLRKNSLGETVGRGRSRLAAPADNTAQYTDLVHQMSAVFSQHLDPSAKRALLMEFRPGLRAAVRDGKVKLDMHEVKAMWDADAEGSLADRILGYMDGKYGEGAHDVITASDRGIASIRTGAEKYLREHGVTPMDERRHYIIDEAHYQKVADEYSALPSIDYERTLRRPTTKQVYGLDTDLKPQPAGVDDRTYKAYQQFVHETKDQFDFMTKPKAEGGMGIKVTVAKGDPYTFDKAGAEAMKRDLSKGQLRVMGIDSDHPLMTNEQNVMFRAVHDVFGHNAEGFSFGPRGEANAAAAHFKMYGPDARGPLLTETHGQTAYVNFSNDVIPGGPARTALDTTDPVLDFEARHPFEVPERQRGGTGPDDPAPDFGTVTLSDDLGGTVEHTYTQRVGEGLRALSPELQHKLLQPLDDLMNEFPGLKVHHVDVVDFEQDLNSLDDNILHGLGTKKSSPFAITFGADHDESVILFNAKYAVPSDFEEDWAMLDARNERMRNYDTFYKEDPKTGKATDQPRESAFGAAHNALQEGADKFDLEQVMRHEAGHAFDVARRPRVKNGAGVYRRQAIAGQEQYSAMMNRFEGQAGRLHLSEYGMKSGEEFAAELFSFTTSPRLDMDLLAKQSPELHAMVTEFRDYLTKVGEWKPTSVGNPLAGKTVREANAAKRGSVYADQKAALLDQSTIDEFARQYVGVGKHVESNPDVARVAQHFGKWSQQAVENGLLRGDNAVHADLIQRIAGIPTGAAAPYNFTEGMAHQLAVSNMSRKWQDAFRLQYFAQSRSMLERTINHPMFGLYPASYMWGKLMPEVVQFLAQRPFGLRTGGALSAGMHAQSEIALRREYDPEFDAKIEELGHSQALSFLGYMLPTLPWDITASAPAWMKDVAAQGQAQSAAVAAGQRPEDLNVVQPATDVLGKLNPLETTIPWMGKAIDEANGANTPKEQLAAALAEAKAGGVQAAELGTPLWYVMQELQAELLK